MTSPLTRPEAWDNVATAYADELAPAFEHFARRALNVAKLYEPGVQLVDVAAGAGALARVATAAGHHVTALDFSPRMVDEMRRRVPAATVVLGDGMNLPFADATFDAGFSMFGLMFFPDRARGFSELRRVLKANAAAVVASWAPLTEVPLLAAAVGALMEAAPPPPDAPPYRPALVDPEACMAEMSAAGFHDVVVHADVDWVETYASVEAFWDSAVRTNAAIAGRRASMGEAWSPVAAHVLTRLRERFDGGEQLLTLRARFTAGRA